MMLTLAASKNFEVQCQDVTRAFLQTEDIVRDVFVIPPVEAGLPKGKCWKLIKPCYGLLDASRSWYLSHAKGLKELGFKAISVDPGTFVKRDKNGTTEAVLGIHVDDSITVGKSSIINETHAEMKKKFKYGTNESLPSTYLGIHMTREGKDIVLDQDHYISDVEIPNSTTVARMKKNETLPEKEQSLFRSLASKLNMLSLTSRPDYSYRAKELTTKYGHATKSDFTQAVKLLKQAKLESTRYVIPDIGKEEDWILLGVTDASNKSSGSLFPVGGFVILLVNKITNAASILFWSSKKIDRIAASSFHAETLSMSSLIKNMYFVRRLGCEIIGSSFEKVPGLILIDNQDLFSCVHNLKSCEDKRLLMEIIAIRQAIYLDKTVSEVRYVESSQMIADCLTKSSKAGEDLLAVIRQGSYIIPGGNKVRDSTLTAVKTWRQLVEAEKQSEDEDETNAIMKVNERL